MEEEPITKKGVSRRGVLIGGALGVAGVGALTFLGTQNRSQKTGGCISTDISATDMKLAISNWPEYIDEDDGDYVSTLTQFQQDMGIDVSYVADVNDNSEFFAKVVNQLGSCAPTGRDMFVLTDWMAAVSYTHLTLPTKRIV